MDKQINSISEFVEVFGEYKTFYFSNEFQDIIVAKPEMSLVMVSENWLSPLLEKANKEELVLIEELLTNKYKTSTFKGMTGNSIDNFLSEIRFKLVYEVKHEQIINR